MKRKQKHNLARAYYKTMKKLSRIKDEKLRMMLAEAIPEKFK